MELPNLFDFVIEGSAVTFSELLFVTGITLVLSILVAMIRRGKGQD